MPINAKVKLCGAKTKRDNTLSCRQPGMKTNGRCRLHGGKSTGPKTSIGKRKSAVANLKHGLYTKRARAEKRKMRMMMGWRKDLDASNL